jgi:hypothetical protein
MKKSIVIGGAGVEENDGGVNSYIYTVRPFVNVPTV